MKIAIHHREGAYSDRWIKFCIEKSINYKIVNCYENDIIEQLKDCDALMWNYTLADYRDMLFAKELLFSLEQSGKVVFPNFMTGWHYNDKLGQKYLFESLGIKIAPAYVFYTRKEALDWASKTVFPKVFKLRGGSSSANVRLAKTRKDAKRFINKAFSRGFSQFYRWGHFRNRIKLYLNGKDTLLGVIKGFLRLFIPTELAKRSGRDKSYVYFQDFIPNDGFDYRIEIVGDFCIAMIRKVRIKDFRASGGHDDHYERELIPKDVIDFAFDVCDKMNSQSCALDIVRNKETQELYLLEDSFWYSLDEEEFSHGYWDRYGNWYNKKFDSRDWMIESIICEIQKKQKYIKSNQKFDNELGH